jgi:integrase
MGRRQFGTVRRLPSGRWQPRYWNGLGERISSPETFPTKGDAQRWLTVIESEQLRGTYIDPRAGRICFADWAEDWLASKPDKRANSIARDRAALTTHFVPAFGHLPVSAVTPVHVRGAVDAMRKKGLSPKSIRTYVGTIAAIFNAAVVADLVPRTPVRGIHLEAAKKRERPPLTPSQLFDLAAEVPDYYRALVLTAGILGLRWSEAIGIRVKDIDFLRRRLSIRQTIEEVAGTVTIVEATKTEAGRRTMAVPSMLVDELARHLAEHRRGADGDDLVFLGPRGGILRRHFLARILKPAAAAVGLPVGKREGLDFHGLRHSATSMMVATGEHPRVMQARLGHATPNLTLGLYAHVSDDVDRAAAERLECLLREDAEGTQRARESE